jgi:chemotaxis protein MotB
MRPACSFPGLLLVLGVVLLAMGCEQRQQLQEANAQLDSLTEVNAELRREVSELESAFAATPERNTRTGITLDPPVYFPSGSAWLTDRARETLDGHAERIKARYENRDFRIKGYTDDRPIGAELRDTYPSNWYLSAQRAAAVAHYLDTEHQIRTRTLEIGAYGPQEAVAPNDTPEGRQQNRRVELVIDGADAE